MANSKISEERDKLREELSIKKKPKLDDLVKFQPKQIAKTQIKRFSINGECSQVFYKLAASFYIFASSI